ncbi:DedA family protein [Corynebacterium lujinxingii]|uniref:DedA family protein n=1 Tax=Corynebacterium lujinxingii TaxID=2763010 RepID=A0A7H0JZC1_9CORY|nr:DedA family protein [Corynebacterium lujinxingii]MBC3179555.1 DedA family protein [Corynebacterium lujinxingii]NNO10248.1 DedA family protein [Corynebacterium lujinxingii]QNP90387.1 DedA family protein [Corynebacterium lujinxingii]
MVDSLIDFLHTLMGMWVFYPLVIVLIIADALAPVVPSETVLNLAGAFSASRGVPNVWGVILAATIGAIIGDNICFALGGKLIHRVDNLDPESKSGQAITWVRQNMNRGAGAMIIVARFIPWARWVATIVLGSVRYNWFKFFFFDTVGVILWANLSVGMGYLGGRILQDYPLLAMLLGVLLGSLVGFSIQKLQNQIFERRDIRRGISAV